jgi:colicin import membrane protein
MTLSRSYRNALIAAVMLHVSIAVMLLIESTNEHPVLTAATRTEANPSLPVATIAPQEQAIKAVSMDSQEVTNTVNRLKEERVRQQRAEENRQRALTQQAELARKQRVEEQQRLDKLKSESAKLAIAHKKQLEDEQRHLKQLAQQKVEEEKHLAEIKQQNIQMQKQQKQEADKLAELKKKKAAELTEQAKQAELAKQAKALDELAKKQQATAAQAALDAQKSALTAGEVDKYKALIIGAISRQWILPENADSKMSSQFRIRLAPNGIVLEVSLTRSSGDPILDRSAQSAIYKASPLPVPSDPDTFNIFRDISLTVRPESARG